MPRMAIINDYLEYWDKKVLFENILMKIMSTTFCSEKFAINNLYATNVEFLGLLEINC